MKTKTALSIVISHIKRAEKNEENGLFCENKMYMVDALKEYTSQVIDEIADTFEDRHDEEVADEIRMFKKNLK